MIGRTRSAPQLCMKAIEDFKSTTSALPFFSSQLSCDEVAVMRLIDVDTLKLVTFHDETKLPKYAILSHRWVEGEEVLYKDLLKGRSHHLAGWDKVNSCCKQAKKDGIQYVWIDTCCVDKRSSAELSEAINSMYRWYGNSELCYAYLNDVLVTGNGQWTDSFTKSAWFTRSWTLQELIAPTNLVTAKT